MITYKIAFKSFSCTFFIVSTRVWSSMHLSLLFIILLAITLPQVNENYVCVCPDFLTVTAVASANLLLENLHNARNLETTYYVTDTKQLTDFFWYRDSGIRVNVGLQNIDVIPTYEDVDHEGDGDFMMHNPSGKSELEYFRSIQSNRCRLVIPNILSIHLYSASRSAHQSEMLPVREIQREESSVERTKKGTWLSR